LTPHARHERGAAPIPDIFIQRGKTTAFSGKKLGRNNCHLQLR